MTKVKAAGGFDFGGRPGPPSAVTTLPAAPATATLPAHVQSADQGKLDEMGEPSAAVAGSPEHCASVIASYHDANALLATDVATAVATDAHVDLTTAVKSYMAAAEHTKDRAFPNR